MRLRKDRTDAPGVRRPGRFPPRAATGAAGELASQHDEQLGRVFRNMRLSMKVSREQIARRLATAVSTVDSFESGTITAFPHWRETERIVRGYCELLRLDPDPVLWRIRRQLQVLASAAGSPANYPVPATRSPPPPYPVAERSAPEQAARRRRWGRVLLALSTPLALAAVVLYLTQTASAPVYRAITLLPDILQEPARTGLDQLMLLTATRRDGLIWVDVGDPSARKADRLQPRSR